MKNAMGRWLTGALSAWALGGALPAVAVEVVFKPVADGVYAYVGDTDGRTYENEGLNANIGLVVTPAGAVLIDSGATAQSARQIRDAAAKVSAQPIRWVINTGGQDHRWLGNGYFLAQGAELIAHADAVADMRNRGHDHLQGLKATLKAPRPTARCRRCPRGCSRARTCASRSVAPSSSSSTAAARTRPAT
jgi:glyoxylase-like metal-dependent hydrolase (beta-lactamase superfamily II)